VKELALSKLRGKDQLNLADIRKVTGAWLREKRERAGFSQRVLAEKVGFDYYTFISQIETGRGKIPSDKYAVYADALGIPRREFGIEMLRSTDPELYEMVFGDMESGLSASGKAEFANVGSGYDTIEARLAKLEALLRR
jgi:transcriptional regulator with XRE-family HTH domain